MFKTKYKITKILSIAKTTWLYRIDYKPWFFWLPIWYFEGIYQSLEIAEEVIEGLRNPIYV